MNDKIKNILEKHLASAMIHSPAIVVRLNCAIIEICEEQKKGCAKVYKLPHNQKFIINSKNIAE